MVIRTNIRRTVAAKQRNNPGIAADAAILWLDGARSEQVYPRWGVKGDVKSWAWWDGGLATYILALKSLEDGWCYKNSPFVTRVISQKGIRVTRIGPPTPLGPYDDSI